MLLDSGRWPAVEWIDLDPDDRSRLLHVDQDGRPLGPLALWLSEQGLPTARNAILAPSLLLTGCPIRFR